MRYSFYTADVFTNRIFGGNPLAVFPQAEGLSDRAMQQIAAEFNYSETVFVLPPETPRGTRKLRIFTPKTELPFAGHPTIGTACVLAAIGEIELTGDTAAIAFEEGVGLVPITITAPSSTHPTAIMTAAQLPEFSTNIPPIPELAAVLSLPVHALLTEPISPQSVSCGVPFLFIPLGDRAALTHCRLNRDRWKAILAGHWASSLYPFYADSNGEVNIHARMFAPSMGIEEDPATGSAATALGGYLANFETRDDTYCWLVEQGRDMGRPSQIRVTASRKQGKLAEICVEGASVMVSQGTMEIPDSQSYQKTGKR